MPTRVLTLLGPTTLLSRLLVLSLAAGCMPGSPDDPLSVETAEGYALAPGPYQIEASHSGKCADVNGASLADNANIHQWGCHGGANQQWTLRDLGTGYYEIKNVNSGKCMHVASASTADRANVHQYQCKGTTHQQWRSVYIGNGVRELRARHSGKCLEVNGAYTTNGANIQQRTCVGIAAQRWRLRALSSGGTGGTGGTGGSGGTTCNYPDWKAGTAYRAGDIVRYPADGRFYIAEHDNPGYDPVISTWFWNPYTCSGSGSGGSTGSGGTSGSGGSTGTGGSTGSGLSAILSQSAFQTMFPNRNSFYTYQGLLEAAGRYTAFGNTGDLTTRKREVAAFLANVNHETGGLVYIEEINKGDYCSPSGSCPCATGKRYYGRGPIQLSWNYNYCSAGAALGLPLQSDPDLVARDPKVAWQTGLWFWMTQSGAGYRPCHQSMVNNYGFGETIRTINGALECGGRNPAQVQSRIDAYRRFCQILGVDPGTNLGC